MNKMPNNIFSKIAGQFQRVLPAPLSVGGYNPLSSRTLPTPTDTTSLQGADYFNNLATTGNPQERVAAQNWLNRQSQPRTLTSQTPSPTSTPVTSNTPTPSPYIAPQSSPKAQNAPTPQITPKTDPYTAYSLLLMEELKKAQKGTDNSELLKRQRELQRESIRLVEGQGVETSLPGLKGGMSPGQYGSVRNAQVNALSPGIDSVQFELKKLENKRADIIEQLQFATQAGDKAREAELNAEEKKYQREQDKLKNDFLLMQFNEDKRRFGLEYALEKQKVTQKENELKTTASTNDTEALNSMNLITTLLESGEDTLDEITGSIEQYRPGFLLGDKANLAKNQYEQVKGILALENRAKLKGSGAVSDFESKTLERAASSVGRNLGAQDFIKQLQQVRGAIATSHGLSADILLIDPITKQSQIVLSDSAGIAQAIQDGLIVEYR